MIHSFTPPLPVTPEKRNTNTCFVEATHLVDIFRVYLTAAAAVFAEAFLNFFFFLRSFEAILFLRNYPKRMILPFNCSRLIFVNSKCYFSSSQAASEGRSYITQSSSSREVAAPPTPKKKITK